MATDTAARAPRERSNETRAAGSHKQSAATHDDAPAAGAHAASHLVNEDATPGAGALPSHAHRSGKDVDGGAG